MGVVSPEPTISKNSRQHRDWIKAKTCSLPKKTCLYRQIVSNPSQAFVKNQEFKIIVACAKLIAPQKGDGNNQVAMWEKLRGRPLNQLE